MTIDAPHPPAPSNGYKPRRLVLMRHAKSDWADPSLTDHDRPLNRRGRESAPMMARWLAEIDVVPDRVLSSSSVRTRETFALMLPLWPREPSTYFTEALYLAPPQSILEAVRREGGAAETLLVIAHNPGMAGLVSTLAQQCLEMPTAAAAVFDVQVDTWPALCTSHDLSLSHFMRPKALM